MSKNVIYSYIYDIFIYSFKIGLACSAALSATENKR